MARIQCVFCGSKPTTKEHAWPAWLAEEYPQLRSVRMAAASGQVMYAGPIQVANQVFSNRQYLAKTFDVQVKVVCKRCNNGWMSDLEASAKPLIGTIMHGTPLSLDAQSQRTLATWTFKTMAMLQFASPRLPPYPASHRQHLYASHEPPPSVFIWSARCIDTPGPTVPLVDYIFYDSSVGRETPSPKVAGPYRYTGAIRINQVAFQLLGIDGGILPSGFDHGYWGQHIIPIWPTGPNISWPPLHPLRSGQWTPFTMRFSKPFRATPKAGGCCI